MNGFICGVNYYYIVGCLKSCVFKFTNGVCKFCVMNFRNLNGIKNKGNYRIVGIQNYYEMDLCQTFT